MKTLLLAIAFFVSTSASAAPVENVYEIIESLEGTYQGDVLSSDLGCVAKIEVLKPNKSLKVTLQLEDGTVKEDIINSSKSTFQGRTGSSDDKYILLASRFKGWWFPRDEYRVWVNTNASELTSLSVMYIQGGLESLYGGYTEYSDVTCINLVKTETL